MNEERFSARSSYGGEDRLTMGIAQPVVEDDGRTFSSEKLRNFRPYPLRGASNQGPLTFQPQPDLRPRPHVLRVRR